MITRFVSTFAVCASTVLLLVLALPAAPASADSFELVDEDGAATGTTVNGTVTDIDFATCRISITVSSGPATYSFLQIKPDDLYNAIYAWQKALAKGASTLAPAQLKKLGEANMVAARLKLAAEAPDAATLKAARERLDDARKYDPSLGARIDAELAVWREMRAAMALEEARGLVVAGSLDAAERNVQTVLKDYDTTAAARDARDLAADIASQREATRTLDATRPERVRPGPLVRIAEGVEKARQLLRDGYDLYYQARNSNCLQPWTDGLRLLEAPGNGVIAELDAIERKASDRSASSDLTLVRDKLNAVRMGLYKAQIHVNLCMGWLSACNTVLVKAMEIDPTDRELLALRLMLDYEYLPPTHVRPDGEPKDPPSDGSGTGSGTDSGTGSSGDATDSKK